MYQLDHLAGGMCHNIKDGIRASGFGSVEEIRAFESPLFPTFFQLPPQSSTSTNVLRDHPQIWETHSAHIIPLSPVCFPTSADFNLVNFASIFQPGCRIRPPKQRRAKPFSNVETASRVIHGSTTSQDTCDPVRTSDKKVSA